MPSVVLALTAHPDDAEFFAGGTLAGMIAAGARAHILVATDGRRGSFEHGSSELAGLRAEEGRRDIWLWLPAVFLKEEASPSPSTKNF